MKFPILICLFLVLGALTLALPSASVNGRSVASLEDIGGFLSPMTYVGPIAPNGQNHSIVGTAEEVHERILELNPSFNPHDWPVPELNVRVSSDPNDGLNALEKRGKAGPAHCGVFDYCNTRRIQRGIDHLNRLPGGCHIGWGTEKCSPVSCSHDASIILCNDNFHDISPSCQRLASYAQDIVNACQSGSKVRGQAFSDRDFNVIVTHQKC